MGGQQTPNGIPDQALVGAIGDQAATVVFNQQQARTPSAAALMGEIFQYIATADMPNGKFQINGSALAVIAEDLAQARGQFGPRRQRLEAGRLLRLVAPACVRRGGGRGSFRTLRVWKDVAGFQAPERDVGQGGSQNPGRFGLRGRGGVLWWRAGWRRHFLLCGRLPG